MAKLNNIVHNKLIKDINEDKKLKEVDKIEIFKKMEEIDIKNEMDQNKLLLENTFMNDEQSATVFIKGVKIF